MRLSCIFLVLIAVSSANITQAQQPAQPQARPQTSSSSSPPSQQQNEWIPRGIDALRQSASSETEFTLDHSMLILASKLDPNNEDLRRVIAGISGISVHNYRYPKPWMYDPQALDSVKDEYHAAGWMQVMNNHEKNGGAGVTDIWIRLENNAISNVAILVAKASEIDFFIVSGSISPIDISHLGGHFGIPRIEGGVVVPNTGHRP